ncbi:hypothetical protein FJT64_011281 [Amphibalanus amphitrite]|uniref:Uncharacterized protein n=1 Tax=Amphibalanus amphitrite TaxID=1232801 RepID=A0A6A4VMM0_AMPAM|nr:hypothetical protein FJT64_011281 [Amphibalanus amphitrite]
MTGEDQPKPKSQVHKLFYMNQMNEAYLSDEKVLKSILKKNRAHGERITRQDMVDNTSILDRENNVWKLRILEAAYILEHCPSMCDQREHRGRITLTG